MKKILSIIAILAVSISAYSKELRLEVPRAELVGTPVPVKLPNLEARTSNPTPEVPDDVSNIAKSKPVTSSDDLPLIGEIEMITDGDKEASEGSYVELMNGVQWVQIDLENESEVFAIAMWHFHSQERAYKDIIIQFSNDEAFKDGVVTVFNNDHDNSSKLGVGKDMAYVETNNGKLVVLEKPLKTRYVRFYSNGNTSNDMNHYIEIEIFGR